MARETSCLTRITAGVAIGGALGGAVGNLSLPFIFLFFPLGGKPLNPYFLLVYRMIVIISTNTSIGRLILVC